MSFMDTIKQTFLDSDGSFCLPEFGAISHGGTVLVGSMAMVAAFIRQVWFKDQTPDYAGFAAGLGALATAGAICVAALGKAMQWRDGQPKGAGDDRDQH